MADRYCAWIRVGGCLKRSRLDEFLAVFKGTRLKLEWGDALFEPADAHELLEVRKGRWLWLCDEEACQGEFPELEDTCRELGLSYRRHSQACSGDDAELVDWRPGMSEPLWQIASNEREAVLIPQSEVRAVLNSLEAGNMHKAISKLRQFCPTLPDLPPFEIH